MGGMILHPKGVLDQERDALGGPHLADEAVAGGRLAQELLEVQELLGRDITLLTGRAQRLWPGRREFDA